MCRGIVLRYIYTPLAELQLTNPKSLEPNRLKARRLPVKSVAKIAISLMMLGTMAVAQAAPAAQKPAAKPAAPAAKPVSPAVTGTDKSADISDSTVVLTISGLCTAGQSPCATSITKGEFEKVAKAINPKLAPDARRNLAAFYIQLLALANESKKEGMDKGPIYEEQLKLTNLRLLASLKSDKLSEGTAATTAEIDAFYNENPDLFQQLAIRRVIIPKTVDKNAVTPEDLKKLADDVQKRCAAGEDTDKLQADVWQKSLLTTTTPNTNFGVLSRGQLNQQQLSQGLVQAITSLKSGETSQVVDDNGFYYIFKVDGKRLVQLKDATDEIAKALQDNKFRAKMNTALSGYKAEKLNEEYFGPNPQAPASAAPAGAKK